MDSLRWILLIVGLGLISGVYFYGRPKKNPRDGGESGKKAGRKTKNRPDFLVESDPDAENLNAELDSLSRLIRTDGPEAVSSDPSDSHAEDPSHAVAEGDGSTEPGGGRQHRDGPGDGPGDQAPRSTEAESDNLPENPDRIVVVHVRGRNGNILGGRLFEAMSKAGLVLGPRKVFHRYHDTAEGQVPLFTVASMVKPGTFDAPDPSMISTPGVSMFMTLPGPMSALDIWDSMLATGNRLVELLEAELLDESFSTMGRQRVSHIREQMREYDRATEIRAQLHSPQGLR